MTGARAVAAHTARVRQAGGKRTSVDLTADALAVLIDLRDAWGEPSDSATICRALLILKDAAPIARMWASNARLGTAK